MGRLKAQINAPIGSISVESSSANDNQADKVIQLQNVVRHVEQSAKWWDADDVEAGDWIFFEERINYWVIQVSKGSAVALVEPCAGRNSPHQVASSRFAGTSYERGKGTRSAKLGVG